MIFTCRLNTTGDPPCGLLRRTCAGPMILPSVTLAVTLPLASEALDAPLMETVPGTTAAQVTGTFGSGFPAPSRTCAVSGNGTAEPGVPDWLFPPVMRKLETVPGWTMKVNGPCCRYP